jgi:hypothetical protein
VMEKHDDRPVWQLVSPEAKVETQGRLVNPHPSDLSGKRVVLYWNGKPNGDVFLDRIGALIGERVRNVEVVKAWEAVPSTEQTDATAEASRVTASKIAFLKPDVVIAAPGDCVGSASWLTADQLNLERLGVPTVTVVTSPLLEVARTVPLAEGFREACFVEIPPPVGMLPSSEVEKKAEEAFEEILKAATDWQLSDNPVIRGASSPAGVLEFRGSIEALNDWFMEKQWSLGLPILPPASERVAEMLDGTTRRPDEVLGQVPPRMGILTVELVAVYATMAGCRPQYMPLIIGALEAFLAPEANWRLALSGTGTSQMIVMVNGPVVKEVGLASMQGAAGKGHHANGSIGYALNLIAYGVGGSMPPSMDRSTLASPADYVCWVFGENEAALPQGWQSLSIERGFADGDSVVTVMAAYPPIENMDHWSASADEHLRWWGSIVSPLQNMGGPPIPQVMEQNPIIALGPEHASLIASAGWSKDDFRKAFWRQTRAPLSSWPKAAVGERLNRTIGPVTDESLIPVTLRPEQFLVVVAGGDGKQSHYFAPLPGSFPVSRLIRRENRPWLGR